MSEAAPLVGWNSHNPGRRLSRRFNTMGHLALDQPDAERSYQRPTTRPTARKMPRRPGCWQLHVVQQASNQTPRGQRRYDSEDAARGQGSWQNDCFDVAS
ncbi:MAG TPA: hypothetical protein VGF67_18845 [Ktedonobacteraceae bacterium]